MSLYVSDDYIEQMSKYLFDSYKLIGEAYGTYQSIMRDVLERGIKEGETHDALDTFISQVGKMNSSVDDSSAYAVGAKYQRFIDDFLLDIDDADKDLY